MCLTSLRNYANIWVKLTLRWLQVEPLWILPIQSSLGGSSHRKDRKVNSDYRPQQDMLVSMGDPHADENCGHPHDLRNLRKNRYTVILGGSSHLVRSLYPWVRGISRATSPQMVFDLFPGLCLLSVFLERHLSGISGGLWPEKKRHQLGSTHIPTPTECDLIISNLQVRKEKKGKFLWGCLTEFIRPINEWVKSVVSTAS